MVSTHPASVSSEKYPYPVDVNVRDFVPINLSNANYFVWKTLMLRLIESQGLVGFINGEVSAPPERITVEDDDDGISTDGTEKIENQNYQDWRRSVDALLQRWIIGTISEYILQHVVRLKTAKDMWSKLIILHERYLAQINVRDFVPIMVSKYNFSKWEKLMLDLIESQGLVGFINGEVSKPIAVADDGPTNTTMLIENEDYNAWKRIDALLQGWIIETIDLDDYSMGSLMTTADEMWHSIKQHCSKDSFSKTETETEEVPINQYLPLHKAALTGKWETAKDLIEQKPDAVRAFITRRKETALMIAVKSVRENHFVKKLLELMAREELALSDNGGMTALHHAAIAGNTEAAKLLVSKNPLLPNYCDHEGLSPLFVAAKFGRREMVLYLLDVTKEDIGPKGAIIVRKLILTGLYDIALSLIQRYPELAWVSPTAPLKIIASKSSSAFRSGAQLNWWQNILYSYVPTKLEDSAYHHSGRDIESSTDISFLSVKQKLHYVIWKVTLMFVPQIKDIQEKKLKQEQVLQLVKHLCSNILELNYSKTKKIIQSSLVRAASSGIPEVVEEIIEEFPDLVYHKNEMGQNIFHVAISNRCENVFNLIYQFREEVRHLLLISKDSNNKRCIDLVVDLKKEQRLNLRASAAGAALQMQRELQWFKVVEKHSIDFYKGHHTKERTTSGAVYTETHEELVKEGEKYMKDTATSCTIIAALIATVVFAAAITVPGGTNDKNGLPILFQDKIFILFVISDALALFSSISSVLMFLAILTSRYSVIDFHFTLPNRLIIGLLFLFVSITFVMIAFGATLYLLFADKGAWILFPIFVFSCFPVTVFLYSQFPLLWDMMISTYGPGIFRKQSNRILF